MKSLSAILQENKFAPADIPELESKLFFNAGGAQRYLVRFTVLLSLSTVIATQGVIADSAATVIGAMIIAPLMTPILAMTGALIMGNGRRAWRSLVLVVGGTLGVISIAAMLGLVEVHIVDFDTNAQIAGRVAPRLLDLVVALAAGAAGAFAMSRDDVADSIPGVAISIALVPPLCVVGISIAGGQWVDAWGALLLFLTNFLSILLAGGGVFALMGLGAAATQGASHLNKRRAYRIIVLGMVLIAIPLSMATHKVWRDSVAQLRVTKIAKNWAQRDASEYFVRSVSVSGSTAKILINGPLQPSTIDDLGSSIRSGVEQIAKVDLRFIPSRDYSYPKSRSG